MALRKAATLFDVASFWHDDLKGLCEAEILWGIWLAQKEACLAACLSWWGVWGYGFRNKDNFKSQLILHCRPVARQLQHYEPHLLRMLPPLMSRFAQARVMVQSGWVLEICLGLAASVCFKQSKAYNQCECFRSSLHVKKKWHPRSTHESI